jgi:hypothetical protein
MTYSYIKIEVKSGNLDRRKKIEHYLTPCYEVFKKIHDLTGIPIHTDSNTVVCKNVDLVDFVKIEIYCAVFEYEKIIAEINPIFECAKKIYNEMQVRVVTKIDIETAKEDKCSESSDAQSDDVESKNSEDVTDE